MKSFSKMLIGLLVFPMNPRLFAWSLDDLKKYSVNQPAAETIWQSLYDFQIYPTAGQTVFSFFQFPIGQGKASAPGSTAGTAKTKLDTNMTLGGALATPTAFIAAGIEVFFLPGSVSTADTFTPAAMLTSAAAAATTTMLPWVEDVQKVINAGGLRMFVGQKEYLFEAPLFRFPPSSFVGVDAAIGNADTTTHNMVAIAAARAMGRPFVLDPAITLIANQNFNVTVEFAGAIATPSGFNGRIGVALLGQFFRNAQ